MGTIEGAQVGGIIKLEPPGIAVATTCSSPNWFSVIFSAVFLPIISASQDVSQTPPVERNAAEQCVVDQTTAGKVANLRTQCRDSDRKVRAAFLHDLLTGTLSGVTVHRNGVRIDGAIIDEPIDINNAQILGDMWLEHCQFFGPVTMHHVTFPWNVSFEGSTFKDYADFESINVGHLAHFNSAVFEKGANFRYANIANNFDALGAVLHGSVFSDIKVGGDALFDNARFLGPVDFRYATSPTISVLTTQHFRTRNVELFSAA